MPWVKPSVKSMLSSDWLPFRFFLLPDFDAAACKKKCCVKGHHKISSNRMIFLIDIHTCTSLLRTPPCLPSSFEYRIFSKFNERALLVSFLSFSKINQCLAAKEYSVHTFIIKKTTPKMKKNTDLFLFLRKKKSF